MKDLEDRVIYYPLAEEVYYQNITIDERDDDEEEEQKEVEDFEEIEENEGGNPRINRIKRFLKNGNKKHLYSVTLGLLILIGFGVKYLF